MSLFVELSRRNVLRVAAAYLVAGWILVEVASLLFDAYEAPPGLLRALIGLVAVGFPIALFFSWAFEITPEGIKREDEVDRSQSITSHTAKRLDLITIGMLVLAIGLLAAERFILTPPSAPVAQVSEAATGPASSSIAVLPFANMSADADNVYFSDGISEEILNVLARVPELQVAARTSSFQFRGEQQDIPAIASELGVATVLEGSVRKQGERVRITAQLIDAGSGFHLWSETYDRDLTDIFEIQDEIAAAIAEALQVHLDVEGGIDFGTEDLEAYDLYLRGVHLWRQRRGDTILLAIDLFKQAKERDPAFARAYEGLAVAYSVLATYADADRQVTTGMARSYAVHALALDPGSATAFSVLGDNPDQYLGYGTAIALLERAVTLDPTDANARGWLALRRMESGDLEGAILDQEASVAIDPGFSLQLINLGYMYAASGRIEDARRMLDQVRETNPDDVWIPALALQAAYAADDREMLAEAVLMHGRAKGNPEATAYTEQLAAAVRGELSEAEITEVASWLAEPAALDIRDPDSPATIWAMDGVLLLLALDRPELALARYEAIYAADIDREWAPYSELYAPLRCYPRYQALMLEIGYEEQVATWPCD
jgi:TolB-like protein/Flp pilus assembly protein TadD